MNKQKILQNRPKMLDKTLYLYNKERTLIITTPKTKLDQAQITINRNSFPITIAQINRIIKRLTEIKPHLIQCKKQLDKQKYLDQMKPKLKKYRYKKGARQKKGRPPKSWYKNKNKIQKWQEYQNSLQLKKTIKILKDFKEISENSSQNNGTPQLQKE